MTSPLGIQSYSLTCRELTIKVAWLASASLNWTPWPQRRPLSHVQLQPVPGIKQCMSLVPHQAGIHVSDVPFVTRSRTQYQQAVYFQQMSSIKNPLRAPKRPVCYHEPLAYYRKHLTYYPGEPLIGPRQSLPLSGMRLSSSSFLSSCFAFSHL